MSTEVIPKKPLPFEISDSIAEVWKLHMNRADLLPKIISPLSNEPCNVIIVGIVVFLPSSLVPKILLLKRAAHDSYPGKWETPGGGVESSDPSIAHAEARELREEASLEVTKIVAELDTNYFVDFKDIRQEDGSYLSRRKTYAQLVHVVEVKDAGVFKTDPNEHSEGFWATQEEAAKLPMLDPMKGVVARAFKWMEEQQTNKSA